MNNIKIKKYLQILLLLMINNPCSGQERKIADNSFNSQSLKRQYTEKLLNILEKTKYFDFVDSRIHGRPEEAGGDWFAHMWTGVKVVIKNGEIYYIHQDNGSDNVGIHSAPYLESSCYAFLLTHDKKFQKTSQNLIRAFSAWITSSEKVNEEKKYVLSRSFYPESYSTVFNGKRLNVDYSKARPGRDTDAAAFVQNENNPSYGKIYLKNNRSIDDIGQMIRSISNVQACKNVFDQNVKDDLNKMNGLYSEWSKRVELNKFIIPTLNKNFKVVVRKNGIGDFNNSNYFGADPNCAGKLAVKSLQDSELKKVTCGNGKSILEVLFDKYLQNDVLEILRAHHISLVAVLNASNKLPTKMLEALKFGLKQRIDLDFKKTLLPKDYSKVDVQDVAAELIHANNLGIPLSESEMNFIYSRLDIFSNELNAGKFDSQINLFNEDRPDGIYNYDPPNTGIYFYTIGTLLGSCALNSSTQDPLLDCEYLKSKIKEIKF